MPKLHIEPDTNVDLDTVINKIAEDLLPFSVPIDTLKYDPLNARLHPEKNLESIKKSLATFGQLKPVVARKGSGIVVAGNGTLEAAKALGWTQLAATFHDMTDAEAAAFGLADNRTAELARWDPEVVVSLEAIAKEGGYDMIGWDDNDLAELHTLLSEDGHLGSTPSRGGSEVSQVVLKITVTPEEEASYTETAKELGMSLTEWIKKVLDAARGID